MTLKNDILCCRCSAWKEVREKGVSLKIEGNETDMNIHFIAFE